jgi:hypothetical protein
MRKIIVALLLVALQIVSLQAITGVASAEILGPTVFKRSPSDAFNITSPVEGRNYRTGSMFVNFTIVLSSEAHYYDVGYSIDNGSIEQINDELVLISDEPLPPDSYLPPCCRLLTYCGSFTLNGLSDGDHTLALYYGSQLTSAEVQYLEKKERYQVTSWSEVHFSVNKVPKVPTQTQLIAPTYQSSPQTIQDNNAILELPTVMVGVVVVVAGLVILLFLVRWRH